MIRTFLVFILILLGACSEAPSPSTPNAASGSERTPSADAGDHAHGDGDAPTMATATTTPMAGTALTTTTHTLRAHGDEKPARATDGASDNADRPRPDPSDHEHEHGGDSAADVGHEDHGDESDEHDDHGHGGGEISDRTTIDAATAKEAGVRTAVVGSGDIVTHLRLTGRVQLDPSASADVTARFPGAIRALHAKIGDRVRRGQALAQIDSNQSLSAYTVASPIDGTVIARPASVGGLAGEAPLYTIADLSALRVEVPLFGRDALAAAPGMPVRIERADGARLDAQIDSFAPAADGASRATLARIALVGQDDLWRPDMAVDALLQTGRRTVAVRAPLSAVQRSEGRSVVFVVDDDEYRSAPVDLGSDDGEFVEILNGLAAGTKIVVEQSFLIKADLEKSGAAHEH